MEEQENGISVKDAVERATRVITDLYSDYQLKDVLLEEVRLLGNKWLVTIGFTRPPQGTTSIGPLTFPERAYKQIEVDAKTGEFLGMEIREFQTKQAERL